MKKILLLSATMAFLAACSDKGPVVAPPCPATVMVQDVADVTVFKPGRGRDLTDVVMEAAIAGIDGFCETDFDDGRVSEVSVDMRVLFQVTRGPANTDRKGTFRYFVAVADRNDKPLQKRIFTTEIEFPGNRNRIAPFEEMSLKIPLKAGENGGDYTVLVGFQLTAEQLEYNRSRQIH